MSTLLGGILGGAAGGAVVAASREAARYLRRRVRRLGGWHHHRAAHRCDTPSASAGSSDAHASYRAAQVRTYADHLARGDARLREQLRRFEKSDGGQQYQEGDQSW